MNWLAIYPEIVLLAMACVVALVDLWVDHPDRTPTYVLAQLSLAVVAAWHFKYFSDGRTVYTMQHMVVADPLGHLLAGFSTVATMAALVYARPYAKSREMLKGELFTLAMFSLLGINVMCAANNFLVIYLGLELMTLALYALTALRRDNLHATEAAMKYFVLGALASGFLLYGMSMLYGATGSLDLVDIFKALGNTRINGGVLALGIVFIVAGLAFKLGAAPFHMWVPDVYHGAPTAVTVLIGAAPKLAAFAILIRLLVEGMPQLALDWQQMFVVLALASIAIGNVVAIAQSNLKRMLAYSSIAQMGFMLLGLCSAVATPAGGLGSGTNGYSSAMFYIVTYVLTTLGSFGIVMLLARQGFEADQIDDLKGLAKRSPWFAGVMAVFMLSLAGVPPTVGFYAKLGVLQALVSSGSAGDVQIAIAAVLLSLIGAYYYLRVIKVMYFDAPTDTQPVVSPADVRLLLTVNGVLVLALGILPDTLLGLCKQAIVVALST